MAHRRLLLVAAVLAALIGLAPAAPAGAATASLTTSPWLVLPGGTATITGPAMTCPNVDGTDTLVVEAIGVGSPATVAQGAAISASIAVPASTAAGVYEVKATCVPYGGSSTVVGTGWLTVTDSAGIPPTAGTCTVSDAEIAWGETFTVTCPESYFGSGYEVQVWMYSDPVLLGTYTTSATGSVVSQVAMPTGAALGSHTVVVASTSPSGQPTFLRVGITVGTALGAQVTTTTAPPAVQAATPAGGGATPATTAATLPATGGGIGLALPAAGLLGLGSAFAMLSRWRERLVRRRV